MSVCWICHRQTADEPVRTLSDGDSQATVHLRCLEQFGLIAREALRTTGQSTPVVGMERLVRNDEGRIILVHRQFPNEKLPILVYLAHFDRPVPVPDIYQWLKENELKIRNPSLALLRLSGKGLVTTQKREDQRWAIITNAGRRMVDEYASSIM